MDPTFRIPRRPRPSSRGPLHPPHALPLSSTLELP
jgi:hypothetical protein